MTRVTENGYTFRNSVKNCFSSLQKSGLLPFRVDPFLERHRWQENVRTGSHKNCLVKKGKKFTLTNLPDCFIGLLYWNLLRSCTALDDIDLILKTFNVVVSLGWLEEVKMFLSLQCIS